MYEARVARVFSIFAGALVLLSVQAFSLQVVLREEILAKHEARVHGRFVLAPRRGEILYADGSPIATNEPGFSVSVNVAAFFTPRWRCGACGAVVARRNRPEACSDAACGAKQAMTPLPPPDADALARLLGFSTEEFGDHLEKADARHRLRPYFRDHQLVKEVNRDTAVALALAADRFPGVVVRARPVRVVDAASADVVGRARDADERDVAALTDPAREERGERKYARPEIYAMHFGKSGLEAAFDARLRGEPGMAKLEGASRTPVAFHAVVDGETLTTTLRRDVQVLAEDVVRDAPGAAAAVVLDVDGGGVVALASNSKDGLEHGVVAIRPGSVFKLATALALLESGVSPEETVRCTGTGRLAGGRPYVCDGVHGDVALTEAFSHSCNCYFSTMAERIGPQAMIDACRALGLDVNPTLGLKGTPAGLDPFWEHGSVWRPGDMAMIGIGQGKALVSPLQVAVAYARVATGGRRITPHLVDAEKPAPAEIDASIARFAPCLREAARRVVTSGTGRSVRELDAVEAAGKSGTGDIRTDVKSHNAWFVAFAPASNPRYVAVVVFEAVPQHGTDVAARPVAKLLAEALK